ncbi:MAG: hypothetical protein WCK89_06255 [bacterium]
MPSPSKTAWNAVSSLPSTEQASLWAALSEARREVHRIAPHQRNDPRNRGYDYYASNPGQRINARFGGTGVRFGSRGETDDDAGRALAGWEAILRLKCVAGEEVAAAADARKSETNRTRMEYRRASGVTEWFENRREGFEHGYTLERRPAGVRAGGDVRIEVALDGLRSRRAETGAGLELCCGDEAILNYSRLTVRDRNGTDLPARMEPTEAGFLLAYRDEGAAYPVTVDPLITSEEAKLTRVDGAAGDWFGCSVSLSGGTALIGAYGDDDGGSGSGSAYVFACSGTNWTLQAKLTAADAAAEGNFGCWVSLSGDTALVGAYGDDNASTNSGSAYVFVRSGTAWMQQAKLTAADAATDDQFGVSVSVSGDTAVVGAYGDDDAGSSSGRAYVFVRSGTVWMQQAKLTAADAATGDAFGVSVSVSGGTAVVGAYGDDDAGSSSGSAYVFVRSGTAWAQQAKLKAADAAAGDSFGYSVSLADDSVVVGAYWDDDKGVNSGSAYVFVRSGTSWTQQAKLTAADGAVDDRFGISVSLSGDTALVGAFMDDDGGEVSGSAYVFARTGTNWIQQAKLIAADDAPYDYFGRSVSLSGDTALVGAHYDDDRGVNSGSAYVFVRSGTAWTQQAKLTAADAAAEDAFGLLVSLSGDSALVGAPGDDDAGDFSGSAYVFVRRGAVWALQTKLTAADAAAEDFFAASVSLSGDTAVIGAPGDDDAGNGSGSAYVFVRSGTSWSPQAKLTAADAAAEDQFGTSVSLSGDNAVIGVPGSDGAGSYSGSAYVFVRSGRNWTQQAKLTAADPVAYDQFGNSVSLAGDSALIGAVGSDASGYFSGSAYVFVRNGANWAQQAKLAAADAAVGDQFGVSVSLAGDTALVGATAEDEGSALGRAYVFVRSGTNWTQQAKLAAADGEANDQFGVSVSLSGDIALVGAGLDDDGGNYSGSAYVFVRGGTNWTQQAKLTASDASADDHFGYSVSLSGDTALVGAYMDDPVGSDSGSIYIFRLQNSGVADLAVFDFLGEARLSGEAAAPFAAITLGTAQDYVFTLRNVGTLGLDIQSVSLNGADAGSFSLTVPDISSTNDLGAMRSMNFTVRFSPAGTNSGLRNASLLIASSDPDHPVFTVNISGPAFSSTADTDGDGMNDWAEYRGRFFGLDWETSQPAFVAVFYDAAHSAGLVQPEEVGGVSSSFVLVSKDPATAMFSLRMRLLECPDLLKTNFVPMTLVPANLNVNGDGDIQYDFHSDEQKMFYRATFR